MLNDEILKALLEGIIYIAPEPVTLEGMLKVLEGEERERVKAKLDELTADYEQNAHGIQIRQVANGYKFSTKAEHHEILRKYVKSLKPPIKLSKPALETLAVIAYRQPVTMPEIEEIRGVDSGGVIHTLLEKKLVVTSGRKSVVGRPILYRTSKDFLVHFGLKDVGELPSLKEFEELAKRALGSDWAAGETPTPTGDAPATPAPEAGIPAVEVVPETSEPAAPTVAEEADPAETPVAPDSAPTKVEGVEAVSAEAPPATEEIPLPDNEVETVAPPAAAEEVAVSSEPLPDSGGDRIPATDETASAETIAEAATPAEAEAPLRVEQPAEPSGEPIPATAEKSPAETTAEPPPSVVEEIKTIESQESEPPAEKPTEN
jgi:segregation and condensation protein B